MNDTKQPSTVYQQRAATTRARRTYPTPRQRRAFAHYIAGGIDNLTKQELDVLSTHPHLLQQQRDEFAKMCEGSAK